MEKKKLFKLVSEFQNKVASLVNKKADTQDRIEREVDESIRGKGNVPNAHLEGDPLDPHIPSSDKVPAPFVAPKAQPEAKPAPREVQVVKDAIPTDLHAALVRGVPSMKGMLYITLNGPNNLNIDYDQDKAAKIGLTDIRQVRYVLTNALSPVFKIDRLLGNSNPEWKSNYL